MSTLPTTNTNNEEELTIRNGNELKRVLKVAGYSQREIADYINFSKSYVNAVCNGSTALTLRVIEAVKECLGDTLYVLAIKRARLLESQQRQQDEARKRAEALAIAQEEELSKQQEEERRQSAIDKLRCKLDD
jgi:transcriptional regulator with XRE-family HTH domain